MSTVIIKLKWFLETVEALPFLHSEYKILGSEWVGRYVLMYFE